MRLMHSDKLAYSLDDLDLKFQTGSTPHAPLADAAPAEAMSAGQEAPAVEVASALADDAPNGEEPLPAARTGPTEHDDDPVWYGRSQIRRLDRLRYLFRTHQKMTRSEVIRILGVSPNTATKDLKALCLDGLIERVEPSASTRSHYFAIAAPPAAHASRPGRADDGES